MSCYYFVRCKVCDVELDDRYELGSELFDLVTEHRETIERVGIIFRTPKFWIVHVFAPSRFEQLALFLFDHRGHELAVVDEYGRGRD